MIASRREISLVYALLSAKLDFSPTCMEFGKKDYLGSPRLLSTKPMLILKEEFFDLLRVIYMLWA